MYITTEYLRKKNSILCIFESVLWVRSFFKISKREITKFACGFYSRKYKSIFDLLFAGKIVHGKLSAVAEAWSQCGVSEKLGNVCLLTWHEERRQNEKLGFFHFVKIVDLWVLGLGLGLGLDFGNYYFFFRLIIDFYILLLLLLFCSGLFYIGPVKIKFLQA